MIRNMTTALCLSTTLLFACSNETPTPREFEVPPPVASESLEVAEALRDLDLGRNRDGVITKLDGALKQAELADAERDRATLGLSRALAQRGDRERAIRLLEERLAERGKDDGWAAEEDFESALYRLVTGEKKLPSAAPDDGAPISAFARAVAPSVAPGPDGRYEISIVLFGGEKSISDRLGTYNIAAAIRALRQESCSVCTDSLSIHTGQHRTRRWTQLPSYKSQLSESLVVFYVDADNRIPARYDSELPMKASEVDAHLAAGQGVIAVATQPGAPPRVLLAAPRSAQLAQVEEKLATMKQLPEAPVTVDLDPKLTSDEIRQAVRSQRGNLKRCYEALLAHDPKARGKLVLAFGIDARGSVEEASVEADALSDPAFTSCVQREIEKLTFPETGNETSVRYPLTFSPE